MPTRIAIGASPDSASASASPVVTCDIARKPLKTSAPMRMRKIIPVACAVSSRLDANAARLNRPVPIATRAVAAAPIAAASVGVNTPR